MRAAAACAELALDYVPDAEGRPGAAVRAARELAEGAGSPAACEAAAESAEGAAQEMTDGSASAAALAAAAAARTSVEPDAASGAAAFAVQAAVLDAGDCAMMSALTYMQQQTAERVRAALPFARIDAQARRSGGVD